MTYLSYRTWKAAVLCTGLLTGVAAVAARGQDPAALLRTPSPPVNGLWVSSLDLKNIVQGFGDPHADRSVDNNPLTLGGVPYPHGIGTHAVADIVVNLKGVATRFQTMAGVDDERKGSGSITFTVYVDGKKMAETGVLHGGDAPELLSIDLTGAKSLKIHVGDAGDGNTDDHADLAGALLTLAPGSSERPILIAEQVVTPAPPRMVMTMPDPVPAIHGPRIVGATPGHPFLFLIPATGQGPLHYAADGLPPGLSLDAVKGTISGALQAAGTTQVRITVRGPRGISRRTLTIVGGAHQLALTPPMGWNSWNVWAGKVDAAKVKAAADEMMTTGLAGHGFQYINIDDTWEAGRDAQGHILSNDKFPDMKALADYVHDKGLRIGLYSSPGPTTCANYTASYQHEDQDARTYADWGFDYLKYDWCSYGSIAAGDNSLPALQKPYVTMQKSLEKVDRDIVYSLCQYGTGDVWTWGAQVDGNCWRTTGDIQDNWRSLHGIYESQAGHEKYAGPGHWNDPDMLMVGIVGFGSTHPTRLTPNEQIMHISLWCLLSSPLLIGCDMTRLDPLTYALLSNDEALDIDQDPLGKPAGRVTPAGDQEVWARPLFDGTQAVGLTNAGPEPRLMIVNWADLGLQGRQPVRDLWLHRNEGTFEDHYPVVVPAHGAVLLKVGRPKPGSV